jgi:hypothetical protein
VSQKFTKELQKFVNAVDRNTRAVAKVVSAMGYLADGGVQEFYGMSVFDKALRELLVERRTLRDGLEKELKRQEGWKK